jgi:hypothetical protein
MRSFGRAGSSALLLTLALAATVAAAAELPENGEAVPDFTLATLEGGSRTLSERTGAGPVVLVFFRGVW